MIPNYPTAEDNLLKHKILKKQQSKINMCNDIDYDRQIQERMKKVLKKSNS